jgi:hypothetical protein
VHFPCDVNPQKNNFETEKQKNKFMIQNVLYVTVIIISCTSVPRLHTLLQLSRHEMHNGGSYIVRRSIADAIEKLLKIHKSVL